MFALLLFCLQHSVTDPQRADRVLSIATSKDIATAVRTLESQYQQTPYAFGLDLAQQRNRPRDAEYWFQSLLKSDPANEEYRFGLAWSRWMLYDMKGALKTVSGLLDSTQSLAKARAHYLIGLIHFQQAIFDKAESHFLAAIQAYKLMSNYVGVAASYRQLGKTKLAMNKIEEAERAQEQAIRANLRVAHEQGVAPFHAGVIYEMYSQTAFQQDQYRSALRYANEAIGPYLEEGNVMNAKLIQVRIGLCQAFMGDLKAAEATARSLDDDVVANGMEKISAYTMLIWIYLNRCRGLDTRLYTKVVKDWARNHDDTLLLNMMKRVLTCKLPDKNK